MSQPLVAISPCRLCTDKDALPFQFTMAFQPIVNVRERTVLAYESLVRGLDGTGAGALLAQVNDTNRYSFDQACRVKSVTLAAQLGISCFLSINFMPNAVYQAATCIRATLEAARVNNFPADRIIFEVSESEEFVDKEHLKNIMGEYRRKGFKTAIDDFGAGYSGLHLLTEFQPDFLKLDMALLRGIDQDKVKQVIVQGMVGVARALSLQVVAEGVETTGELGYLRSIGIDLFQGYLFARPAVEALPTVQWPD